MNCRSLLTNGAAISVANSIDSYTAWTVATVCCVIPLNAILNKLQRIQKPLARVTCQSPGSSSASSLRKSFHWLPVRQRVIYKTAPITYKTLRDLLLHHQPARTLRSSSQLLSRRQGSTSHPQHSVSRHQLSGTLCLQLQNVPLPSPLSRYI